MPRKDNNSALFNISLILLIVAIAVFLFNAGKFLELTGYATTGTTNLTISTVTSINFSTANISFGKGAVTPGQIAAQLSTSDGTVTNGNWTANQKGFLIENIGNVNVSLEISVGKTAAAFIGGANGGTGPTDGDGDYRINVSSNESGSCRNNTAGFGNRMVSGYTLGKWVNANSSSPGTQYCDNFRYKDGTDEVRVDVYLNISATSSVTGSQEDTLTATATAI